MFNLVKRDAKQKASNSHGTHQISSTRIILQLLEGGEAFCELVFVSFFLAIHKIVGFFPFEKRT
jgi:hypothetical protein